MNERERERGVMYGDLRSDFAPPWPAVQSFSLSCLLAGTV
jgi:hypothetical protein